MTTAERGRLNLVVDGYTSLAKAAWAAWGMLLLWRLYLWWAGPGSVGDVTLFALFVMLPIAASGLADGATTAHRADLKGNMVAGLSERVDAVGGDHIVVKDIHFDVPNSIASQLEVGDMVAVEFAPTTRLVMQVHRLQRPKEPKQLQESEGDTVTVE